MRSFLAVDAVLQVNSGHPGLPLGAAAAAYWARGARRSPSVRRISLALEAAKLLGERGTNARVVSMPSWKLFDAQDESYRASVLPPEVKARISIEAGATLGWSKYVGGRRTSATSLRKI